MNNEKEPEPDVRRGENERREEETATDAERMLDNTQRFLEQLANPEPEARQYVAGLKKQLKNEIRHSSARRRDRPKSSDPANEH